MSVVKALLSKKGSGYIWAITIVIALIIIFSGISEYLRMKQITETVRDHLQAAIISVATSNYDDLYNGLREGYSGGYQLNSQGHWVSQIDYGSIYYTLDQSLGLREEGGKHIKYAGDGYDYKLSNLIISISNTSFAPTSQATANRFEATAWITIEIPYSFGFQQLEPLKIDLKVKAAYTAKF